MRRLRESKAAAKSKVKTKDFGITFLVLLAVFVVVAVVKFYMDYKVKKALEFLNKEKERPRVEAYYQRIQESSLEMNYCITLQTLNKLSNSQTILSKILEEDLKDELLLNKDVSSVDKLRGRINTYLVKRKQSAIQTAMTEECYNSYKHRQGWTSTTTTEEEDLGEQEEMDVIGEGADLVFNGDNLENVGKYSDITDTVKSSVAEKETIKVLRDDNWDGPGVGDVVNVFGAGIDNLKDLIDGYKTFKELNDPNKSVVEKVFSVLKWVFTATHNVLKTVGKVEVLTGAASSINFPFFSIAASVTSMLAKLVEYINAVNAQKNDTKKNPVLKLNRELAFYELIDELMDGVESIVTTCLTFIAPLTAGISSAINLSIKIFIKLLHIGVAALKLKMISKLKPKIVEYYNKVVQEQREEFLKYKSELIKRQCSKTISLVRIFLERELKDIENKYANAKALLGDKLSDTSLSDDEVNRSVTRILSVVCELEPEDCLSILSSSEFNLDLDTIYNLDYSLYTKAYEISKGAKFGAINSAFMITKKFTAPTDGDSVKFFEEYIPRSQTLFLSNGYFPVFQGESSELWVCRVCANPSYKLKAITQNLSINDLKRAVSSKPIVQESVEGFGTGTGEITRFFLAEYQAEEAKNFYSKEVKYNNILPNRAGENESLEFVKFTESVLASHDTLAICTSPVEDLKDVTSILVEARLPILQTVYHPAQIKDGETRTFVTLLLSYRNPSYEDLVTIQEELKKKKGYLNVIAENIRDVRHDHFAIVVNKMVYQKVGKEKIWKADPDFYNINSATLTESGWKILRDSTKEYKDLEQTYKVERIFILSDLYFKFALTVFTKEYIRLKPKRGTPPSLRETLTNLVAASNNNKKLIISNLHSLYCDSCSEVDALRPLSYTRANVKFNFCEIEKSGTESQNNFLSFIKNTAKKAAKSHGSDLNDDVKNKICTISKEVKQYFNVTSTDENIDNAQKCSRSLAA